MNMFHPHTQIDRDREIEETKHLQPWGWAPGGYMFSCKDVAHVEHYQEGGWNEGAKHSRRCRPCAERAFATYNALPKVEPVKVRTPQLTRDKCVPRPGIVEAQDRVSKPLTVALLVAKLHSEAEEIALDLTNPEEYGDLIETVYALAGVMGVSEEKIRDEMLRKRTRKGGLATGNFWTPEYFMEKTDVS